MSSITSSKTVCQPVSGKKIPIFAHPKTDDTYLFDRSEMFSRLVTADLRKQHDFESPLNITIPLVVDTEFEGSSLHWIDKAQGTRVGIVTQVKSIQKEDKGVIVAHPEVAHLIPRHPVAHSEFHPIDYLKLMGYQAEIEVMESVPEDLPIAHFYLYGHMLLAELLMIVRGKCRQTFIDLLKENNRDNPNAPKIEMTRRLTASSTVKNGRGTKNNQYVDLPWKMNLEGDDYAVRMTFIDTIAIHGQSTYKAFCEASGLTSELKDKDNFDDSEKGRMLTMAIEQPEKFDAYALGDLHVYDALEGNAEGFKKIYQLLGLEEYYVEPRLTIGATTVNLFKAALQAHCGIKPPSNGYPRKEFKQLETDFLAPASAQVLRTLSNSTNAILSKVEGGRCRHNRPTDIRFDEPLVDIDINGCYGEGQRNQIYLIGVPEMSDWKSSSTRNDYWTLAQFRKEFKGELVAGAWQARVTTSEPLKHRQDFLASWFTDNGAGENIMAKYVKTMPCDTEENEFEITSDFDEEDGILKYFNHEILNGVIGHDFLEWLDYVCSAQQRKELESKLLVKAYMVYPASQRVDSYQALLDAHATHKGKNTATRVGKKGESKKLRIEDGECHVWYDIDMGKLIVDKLLANRKCFLKKTPMNTLFKLVINTLYGVMVSKYFTISNTCVGNNITARARALAWYMEKGLNGFQTVTDGNTFLLNATISAFSERRVTSLEVTNYYRKTKNGEVKTAPLGGFERINLNWVEGKKGFDPVLTLIGKDGTSTVLQGDDAFAWVNKTAMEHLQMLFPKVSVLHAPSTSIKPIVEDGKLVRIDYVPRVGQFEFEAKAFYNQIATHASANYCLVNPNGKTLAMRSYESKKPHSAAKFDGEVPVESVRYNRENNPATDLMGQLVTNPERVVRQEPFVKNAILKPGDYKQRPEHWDSLELSPGDSYNKSGMLSEFSLSQFTFQTLEQYQGWSKAIMPRKDKYRQSLEQFFLNADGTLNYKKMVETVDKLIADGVINPFDALDPNRNAARDRLGRLAPHPELDNYNKLKSYLNTPPVKDNF